MHTKLNRSTYTFYYFVYTERKRILTEGHNTCDVGETVRLPCVSDKPTELASWMFTDASSKNHDVYLEGLIMNGFRNRFSVDRSVNDNYELVISKTEVTDSGIYRCSRSEDGGSTQRTFEYHVSVTPSTLMFYWLTN